MLIFTVKTKTAPPFIKTETNLSQILELESVEILECESIYVTHKDSPACPQVSDLSPAAYHSQASQLSVILSQLLKEEESKLIDRVPLQGFF